MLGDEEYDDLAAAHPVPNRRLARSPSRRVRRTSRRTSHDERFAAFAHGRPAIAFDPEWADAPILDVPARGLAFYSYFFHLAPDRRRELFSLLEQIRPKQPYRDLASSVAAELGPFNAAHIRRTDHLVGVPDYRRVTPWMIRDNLAAVFPADERLVVCTEADAESDVFKPLRAHFGDVVFLSPLRARRSAPWRAVRRAGATR